MKTLLAALTAGLLSVGAYAQAPAAPVNTATPALSAPAPHAKASKSHKAGHKKVVTATWKYAAGEESVAGFKKVFTAGGGEVMKEITLPFPDVEFQSILTEIGTLKPDALPLIDIAANRKKASELVDKVGYNDGPAQ